MGSNIDAFVGCHLLGLVTDISKSAVIYKAGLDRMPILGPILKAMRWIPIRFKSGAREDLSTDRESALACKDACERVLREGGNLCLFPEGCRMPEGSIGPFKPFIFRLAQQMDIPILPITLRGTGNVMPIDCNSIRPWQPIELTAHPLMRAGEGEEIDDFVHRVRAVMADGD